jgi:hypothetical protein
MCHLCTDISSPEMLCTLTADFLGSSTWAFRDLSLLWREGFVGGVLASLQGKPPALPSKQKATIFLPQCCFSIHGIQDVYKVPPGGGEQQWPLGLQGHPAGSGVGG